MAWRSIPFCFLLLVLAIASQVNPAQAQGMGDDLYISGFVSQGYLNTSENNYLVPRSVNGTAEFTEAALLVSASPMDRLRIGIQFLARNFGSQGTGQVQLDWAFGDYRWYDQLGFRAGRVKLPFGLYNEGRDVDLLRTSVFLPQSVYNERIRDMIQAYEGAGAYGNIQLGGFGELDYHVFGGTLNVPDSTAELWRENTGEAGDSLAEVLALLNDQQNGWDPGTTEVEFQNDENAVITFPWIWGGSVIWSTPLEGLRLGSTFMNGRFNYSGDFLFEYREPDSDPVQVEMAVDQTNHINHEFTLSAEYTWDNLLLATEYYHEDIENEGSLGWYGKARYRFSELFSLASYYSVSYADGDDLEGDRYSSVGLPEYYAWLKDLTLSTRFDLTDFWLLKLEYHFFDGVEQGIDRNLSEELAEPMAQNWGMFTAKTTFSF